MPGSVGREGVGSAVVGGLEKGGSRSTRDQSGDWVRQRF